MKRKLDLIITLVIVFFIVTLSSCQDMKKQSEFSNGPVKVICGELGEITFEKTYPNRLAVSLYSDRGEAGVYERDAPPLRHVVFVTTNGWCRMDFGSEKTGRRE